MFQTFFQNACVIITISIINSKYSHTQYPYLYIMHHTVHTSPLCYLSYAIPYILLTGGDNMTGLYFSFITCIISHLLVFGKVSLLPKSQNTSLHHLPYQVRGPGHVVDSFTRPWTMLLETNFYILKFFYSP
jgi:hypothetical protein